VLLISVWLSLETHCTFRVGEDLTVADERATTGYFRIWKFSALLNYYSVFLIMRRTLLRVARVLEAALRLVSIYRRCGSMSGQKNQNATAPC